VEVLSFILLLSIGCFSDLYRYLPYDYFGKKAVFVLF